MNSVAVADLRFRGLSVPRNDSICGQDRWMRHFLVGNKLSFGILNENNNLLSNIMWWLTFAEQFALKYNKKLGPRATKNWLSIHSLKKIKISSKYSQISIKLI